MNYDNILDLVKSNIHGRVAISDNEARLLCQYASQSKCWVEIGTLWGGTAALAGLAGAERVYTIDTMNTVFWTYGDPGVKGVEQAPMAAEYVLDNLQRFNVAHKTSIIKAPSDPWPLPRDVKPDAILVDGDHTLNGCARDLLNAQQISTRYILVHDFDSKHRGVKIAVENFIKDAWGLVDQADTMRVYKYAALG